MAVDSQRVHDAGYVAQYRQQDVDQEVGVAAALEKDTEGRQEDGEDDLAEVTGEMQRQLKSRTSCWDSTMKRRRYLGEEAERLYLAVKAILSKGVLRREADNKLGC